MNQQEFKQLHTQIMDEIQEEWLSDITPHTYQRDKNEAGIRSSQISALVAYLIKKGIIDEIPPIEFEPRGNEMIPIPHRSCKAEIDGQRCGAVLFRTTSGIVCDQGHGGVE